jgi:hypothetical protein
VKTSGVGLSFMAYMAYIVGVVDGESLEGLPEEQKEMLDNAISTRRTCVLGK